MYQRHRSYVCMRKSDGAISISFSLSLFFRSMLRRGSSLNDLSLRPLPSFGSLFWFHYHAGARFFLLSILFPYLPLLGSDLLCYWSETPVFFLLFCSSLRIIFFRRSSHPLYLATSALRSFLPSLAARLISSLYSTPATLALSSKQRAKISFSIPLIPHQTIHERHLSQVFIRLLHSFISLRFPRLLILLTRISRCIQYFLGSTESPIRMSEIGCR